jgi:hypothetical protein
LLFFPFFPPCSPSSPCRYRRGCRQAQPSPGQGHEGAQRGVPQASHFDGHSLGRGPSSFCLPSLRKAHPILPYRLLPRLRRSVLSSAVVVSFVFSLFPLSNHTHLVSSQVYGAGSEDMDTLTFNSPVVLRHLTFSEARKMPIDVISLDVVLEGLELTMDQVCLSLPPSAPLTRLTICTRSSSTCACFAVATTSSRSRASERRRR